MSIGCPLFRQSSGLRRRHIFEPLGSFPRSSRSDIDRKISVSANLIEKVHEFVSSERVRLDHTSPIGIERNCSIRADTVPPVVLVREATSWPTHVRDSDCF